MIMNDFQNLIVERSGDVLVVTLNRPKALNALNTGTLVELDMVLSILAVDQKIRVLILTGSGEKAFVAGADVSRDAADDAQLRPVDWAGLGQSVFARLEKSAAASDRRGQRFRTRRRLRTGAGVRYSHCCRERAASVSPRSVSGSRPVSAARSASPRLVGQAVVRLNSCFRQTPIDAAEALRIGLVNKVVPVGQALEVALALAHSGSRSAVPVAIGYCKAAVEARALTPRSTSAIAYEAEVFGLCFADADQKEGMSAFTERRTPAFAGG